MDDPSDLPTGGAIAVVAIILTTLILVGCVLILGGVI